jgi:RNA polymerase sigma-70 factor (ECF subfamily)
VDDRRDTAEAALVRACADGDRVAWEKFVVGYGALLTALARRMLLRRTGRGTDADADDVVSRVFLALLKNDRRLLRRYRPEFRLSTYLGVICRSEVGRHLRGRAAPLSLDGPDWSASEAPDPSAETPLTALERSERTAALGALRDALGRLAPRDRLILSLKFVDGLEYAEIADVLRVRRDSVGQLLHRAKQRLARLVPNLAQWVEAEDGP